MVFAKGSRISRRQRRRIGLVVVLITTLFVSGAAPLSSELGMTTAALSSAAAPPRAHGYFQLRGPGSWSGLPGDTQCAARIHESTWEPRQVNTKRNSVMPDAAAVHRALAIRPRDTSGAYDKRWDTWLLPRVDGQFQGTTDEILQWGACKWGLPDNLLRAIAVRESTWYQYPTYRSGMCVNRWGCGDPFSEADPTTKTFCDGLGQFGYDYQQDYGSGMCPKTFSIIGIMAWQDPDWGRMPGNQNGTFPFSRDSTAFAVDYFGAYLRGCFEGWELWLGHSVRPGYAPGRLWGCVGSWYSGGWHDPAANEYIANVKAEWGAHPWLDVGWPIVGPGCSTQYGCIGPDPLPLQTWRVLPGPS